jgi:23S rRNA (cytosine1962-C5)-methyltransferase
MEEITLPNIADGEDKSSPLANRIRKNYRHVRKWAKRTHTNCFRVYDRELPHYPLAIDFYDGRFCVQYFLRSQEESEPPESLIQDTQTALNLVFGAAPETIFWKTRKQRQRMEQYEKVAETRDYFTVIEYGVKFRVNLTNYLDTGLFLDHRETRHMVAQRAAGKRLLNLFAYTCSFSVQAAANGASFTKSVDMSNTYTAWGEKNFRLNGLPLDQNPVIRADCMVFLDQEIRSGNRYDLIVIDPPTISRSKKMSRIFDVQEDYIFLISKALKLLSPTGTIFFSTNSRKFSLDAAAFSDCTIKEVTEKTLPLDFHDPKIHRCWRIEWSQPE